MNRFQNDRLTAQSNLLELRDGKCVFMWEEDPRWQEANFRFLVSGTAFLAVLATAYGLAFQEWKFPAFWYSVLGILIVAVGIYGVIVWLIVRAVILTSRILRRWINGG